MWPLTSEEGTASGKQTSVIGQHKFAVEDSNIAEEYIVSHGSFWDVQSEHHDNKEQYGSRQILQKHVVNHIYSSARDTLIPYWVYRRSCAISTLSTEWPFILSVQSSHTYSFNSDTFLGRRIRFAFITFLERKMNKVKPPLCQCYGCKTYRMPA